MKSFPALIFLILLFPGLARAQDMPPSIGYVYPAGGQRGATLQIIAGGQNLRGASDAYFTGDGIKVVAVEHVPALRPLHISELGRRMREIRNARRAAARGEIPSPDAPAPVMLPDHPMLRGLEEMSPDELRAVARYFLDPRRRDQLKRSIQELAVIDIEISPDAAPGEVEMRVRTPLGLTNPISFRVGLLPEIMEKEPNDPVIASPMPVPDPPVLINGQITIGDIDRFKFRAKQGQRLVIEARARQLVPYMADAVPGWFQAVLTLYCADGRQVAFADNYNISSDPVIFYEVTRDGEYVIEIRDAIHRGREDFVYRLSIGESPFITHIFPLGGREGVKTASMAHGWNLVRDSIPLDTEPGPGKIRVASLACGGLLSNRVPYAVDNLPEITEAEPNDSIASAQDVSMPVIINGRIDSPGDVDVFRVKGRAGEKVAAEVYARRLDSPLDSLLRLTDSSGSILVWNDDTQDAGSGLNTHHADSYIMFTFPDDGTCYFHLSDAQGQGGWEYSYRLRISRPMPDFDLRVTPSSLNVPAGCAVAFNVRAIRRDGFDGDIEIYLENAPAGFSLGGAIIPAGLDSVHMTLSGPRRRLVDPVELKLAGSAVINGRMLIRQAVPAENMMQAFGYRHLVPSWKLMAAVTGSRGRLPSPELASGVPVNIPAGGEAWARFVFPSYAQLPPVRVEVLEAPAGISIAGVEAADESTIVLRLKSDSHEAASGWAGNLIAGLFADATAGVPGGEAASRNFLGVLPAIPIRIVSHQEYE